MTLAILEARTTSSRMPGRAMAPVLGEPMIWRQLERIRRARSLSKVVVVASSAPADDALASFLLGRGCSVHRDAADPLARFAACATGWSCTRVVRLEADRPLVDPQVIDAAVQLSVNSGADYTSNREVLTYPQGLEVEVFSAEALAAAAREAYDPADRDDVATYVRRFPLRFRQAQLTLPRDLSDLRWTVEGPEDFAFVREIFRRLHRETPDFGLQEVMELLETRPELAVFTGDARRAVA